MMMKTLSILLAVNSVSALRGGSSGRNRQMQQEAPAPPNTRNLSTGLECTLDDFAASVGSKSALITLLDLSLSVTDDAGIQAELDALCAGARTPTV